MKLKKLFDPQITQIGADFYKTFLRLLLRQMTPKASFQSAACLGLICANLRNLRIFPEFLSGRAVLTGNDQFSPEAP